MSDNLDPEQAHESAEVPDDATQADSPQSPDDTSRKNEKPRVDENIDVSNGNDETEKSQLASEQREIPEPAPAEQQETSEPEALPDMEATIELSQREQRILRYLARRRTRLAQPMPVPPQSEPEIVDDGTPGKEARPQEELFPLFSELRSDQPQGLELFLQPTLLLPVPPSEAHQPAPWFSDTRSRKLRDPRRRQRIARLQYIARKHLRRARANDRRASRKLWSRIWVTFSSFLLLFLVVGGVVAYVAYNYISNAQGTYGSQVLSLRDLLPPDNLKIYDSQGTLLDQLADQGIHTTVSYAQLSSNTQLTPDIVNATVAIEDKTFWENTGVDLNGILRAAYADAQEGQPIEGGSTITQQLIKELIVGSSDDIQRKLNELILAPQVNSHYSKQDIMDMYLNTIFYGHLAYGIDAAATIYFGLEDKPGHSAASQLDLAQAILLAGLPRNASLYNPFAHPKTSMQRVQEVIAAMIQQKYITQLQAQAALQEIQSPDFYKNYSTSQTLQDQAPHFDEYIISQLEQAFHLQRSQISRSGLIVSTTLDLPLQQQILPIMRSHIASIPAYKHVTNAAEVLIDFHTGAVLSLLGSLDYYDKAIDGQYDVALAYRQPGSSFKPYVYVTAFANGISPAQAVDDAPTNFPNPGGTPNPYSPLNYDLHFHGHMTLRCALQNSLNIPAVRVLDHVGVQNALQTAEAMGISSYQGTPGLSMVLGGLSIRLLDHTSAIGVFANGGVREPYYSISKIVQGSTGKVLFQHQLKPGVQVITPQLAYMMTSVLSDNTSRIPDFGVCNVLQLYSNSVQDCRRGDRGPVRPAAAKTGTTQDFRDNWTVGYTTDYVMGVWAGNDDDSPMRGVTGLDGAAPIWHDAMLLAEQGHPIQDFPNPGGLVRATVTYADGVRSTDWFLPGTVPSSVPAPTPTPSDQGFSSTNALPVMNPETPESAQDGAAPFCGTFSFAFAPPPPGGMPASGAWW